MPRPADRSFPSQRRAITLIPSDRGVELPEWSPSAPPDGWTPSTAWAAALDYAEEHEGNYTQHVLARAAYRSLLGAVPGLHRADVVARLQGVAVSTVVAKEADPRL